MMKEKKILTEYRTFKAVQNNVDLNKRMKIDFEVLQSNYTTTINYPKTGYKHKFITSNLSQWVFITYQKMKAEILKNANPDFWKNDFEKNISLYDCNDEPQINDLDFLINFDLKNAYPSALERAGFISPEVCEFIQKRKKIHRLQAIGIFASRKSIFKYERGILNDIENSESELKNVYFFASKVTDNIIKAARQEAGDDFVFYWFDGIYIRPNAKTEKRLTEFFEHHNFEYKKEVIKDLDINIQANKTNINYTDSKGKKKLFNIPHNGHRERKTAGQIIKILT